MSSSWAQEDVNGTFLPPLAANPLNGTSATPSLDSDSRSAESSPSPTTPDLELSVSATAGLVAQSKLLNAVSEERPLAQLQEKLNAEEVDAQTNGGPPLSLGGKSESGTQELGSSAGVAAKQPLLKATDGELDRLARVRTLHICWVHS